MTNNIYQVTPNLESVPERTYVHDGHGTIICYKYETVIVLFTFHLDKCVAEMLMQDLYAGEYTGG